MKRNSLWKNYIYNWISQILTLLVPLITAPYLARTLHEIGNGQITFVHSVVAYFVSFAAFGFSIYGQREIARHQDNVREQSRIFIEIFLLKCIFSVISLAVLFSLMALGAFQNQYRALILFDSIQIVAVIFDIQFYYQGIENFRAIAVRTIVLRVLVILSVFLFVKSEEDVLVYVFLYAVSILVSNLSMWPPIFRSIQWDEKKNIKIFRHFKPSFFVFLPVISGTILSYLDETMIGYMSFNPEYENGCYGAALKLISVITLLVTVDTQVLASRNAVDFARGDIESLKRHLKFGFDYVWILVFPLIVGILILSAHLSSWFFGPGFERVPALLKIFTLRLIAQGLMFVLGNQYFIQTGREKLCTGVNIFGIIVNIIMNSLLIPKYGSIGASVASVSSEIIMLLIFAFHFYKDEIGQQIPALASIKNYIIAAAIMGIPTYALSLYTGWTFASFILITIAGMVVYFGTLALLKDEFFLHNFVVFKKKILKAKG